MDLLPKVFANPIDKEINNVQTMYRDNEIRNDKPVNITKKINEIFASPNHVYKSKVKIIYKDHEEIREIVGKTNLNLLTLDGKLIKITDIIDIEKI